MKTPPPDRLAPRPAAVGRLLLHWGPLLAWMAAIFVLSSQTPSDIDRIASPMHGTPLRISSEAAHTVEFGVLALLLYRAFRRSNAMGRRILWAAVLVLTIAAGATDELHQSFVPGRVPSWWDLAFDSLGGLVGVSLAELAVALRRFFRVAG